MDLTKYPMDRQVCTLQLESCEYLVPSHPPSPATSPTSMDSLSIT